MRRFARWLLPVLLAGLPMAGLLAAPLAEICYSAEQAYQRPPHPTQRPATSVHSPVC